MNKLFAKLLALILTVQLVLSGPVGLVLADASPAPSSDPSPTTTSSNTDTGSTSNNTATTTDNSTSNSTSNNTATVNNDTTGNVTSGTNTSTQNTGDASVTTSNSTANSTTNTTVNTNGVDPSSSPAPTYSPDPWTTWTGSGDWTNNYNAGNTQTGSGSNNTANNTANQTSNTTNNNLATVNNNTQVGSNTGTNNTSQNTGNASIQTGDATTSTSTSTVANLNGGYWTGQGDWTTLWNGEAANYLTGATSNNTASNNFQQVVNVLNNNGVDVNNLLKTFANSGGNTASQNTGNATITTGNSSLLSTLFNLANTNVFGTGNVNVLSQDVYGNYSGNIDLSNATAYSLAQLLGSPLTLNSGNNTTGSQSTNNAANNGSLTLAVTNNNNGILNNNLNLQSITGGNSASDNTGNAQISTGDASIIGNVINMLNTNLFTNNLYLGEVNVYGNWLGNLILPDYPSTTPAAATPSASLASANTMTGAISDNNSTTNTTSNATTTNNNTGAVNNNFDVTSSTGGNAASDNTLNGTVNAGSATANANIGTWSNTNVASTAPWWLVMVNDLGHWIPILNNSMTGARVVLDGSSLASLAGSNAPVSDNSNTLTGFGSTNNSTSNTTTDATLTNNNAGTINNNIVAKAQTGNNDASRNTGSSDITTGDSSVLLNVLNFLNTNISAPSIMLTFVNVFGSWTGDILNHADPAPIPSPSASPAVAVASAQGGSDPGSSSGNSSSGGSSSSSSSSSSGSGGSVNTSSTTSGSNPLIKTVSYISSNASSTSGQVLSFVEANPSVQGAAANLNSNSPLQNFILGFIVAISLVALYATRRKAWQFLLKLRTMNLF